VSQSKYPFIREVNEAVDWDRRKTLADVWQSVARIPSLDEDVYLALITVAQWGARSALENAAADAAPMTEEDVLATHARIIDDPDAPHRGVDHLVAFARALGIEVTR